MSDDEVAIYNLVGQVRVEPGTGGERDRAGDPGRRRGGPAQGGAERARRRRRRSGSSIPATGSSTAGHPPAARPPSFGSGTTAPSGTRETTTTRTARRRDARSPSRAAAAGSMPGPTCGSGSRPASRSSVYLAVGKVSVTNVNGTIHHRRRHGAGHRLQHPGRAGDRRGRRRSAGDPGERRAIGGHRLGRRDRLRCAGRIDLDRDRLGRRHRDRVLNSSQLSIDTGSGDIQVTSLMAPQVSLETGSGSVTADLQRRDLERERGDRLGRRDAEGAAHARARRWTSRPPAATSRPTSRWPVTRHARDHMTGQDRRGRGKIDIETGSGGIKLVKA